MRQQDPIELIRQLTRALELTRCDAERNSRTRYGDQSNCIKALKAVGRFFARDAVLPRAAPTSAQDAAIPFLPTDYPAKP